MKNIFNGQDNSEIIERLEKLSPDAKALWGKMNVAQMLAHCHIATQMTTGEINPRRATFPVNIIGRLLKPRMLGPAPLPKNTPTIPEAMIKETRNFQTEKLNFTAALKRMAAEGEKCAKAQFHPFMGKMTPNEWGRINYKHADHHLKQFGA